MEYTISADFTENSLDPSLILNLTLEQYLEQIFIDPQLVDDIYMFAMAPMNIIGSFLNLVSIYIFFGEHFRIPFFNYFKILSINSFIHL